MSVQGDKASFGLAGNYTGAVETGISDDGLELYFKDTKKGKMTLSAVLNSVAAHNIGDHGNMATDFATQYYNSARLTAFLADAAKGNAIGVSGDVGANASLGAHVMDPEIHQRVPKFVLRVAKGGQKYSTIGAALAAVPTSGADAPSPDRWWRVEVSPGVYNEKVLLNKQWVELVGAGSESTRITWDNAAAPGTWPLFISASNVVVRGLFVESTDSTSDDNVALLVGTKAGSSGPVNVAVKNCMVSSLGEYAVWTSTGTRSEFDDCRLLANAYIMRNDGYIRLNGCYFQTATEGYVEAAVDHRGVFSVLSNCQSEMVLLSLVNTGAFVGGCWNTSGYVVAVSGVGNTSSSVHWDGDGFTSSFSPDVMLSIIRSNDSGLFTKRSALIDWVIASYPVQEHFKAGHSGTSTFEDGVFGDGGPDFDFYRRVTMGSEPLVGDVYAIGDDSSSPGGNSTNALSLYLGDNNDSGKFLRWGRGDMAAYDELGYIGGDGVVHAPGFAGSGAGLTGVARLDAANTFTNNNPQVITGNVATHWTGLLVQNTNPSFRGEIQVKGAGGGGILFSTNAGTQWAFSAAGDLGFYNYAAPAGGVLSLLGGANKGSSFNATGTGNHLYPS